MSKAEILSFAVFRLAQDDPEGLNDPKDRSVTLRAVPSVLSRNEIGHPLMGVPFEYRQMPKA